MAPQPGGVRTARRLLLAAAGVLALYLLLAPKPWSAASGPGYFATPERPMVDVILIGFWWMAIPNALLCLALAAAAPLWAGPAQAPVWPSAPPRRRGGALFLTLLLLAALLGGALRWNLAHGSLWWDEAWTVKRAVVGHREPVPEDPTQLSFREVRWHWTFFHYKKPTNHVLYSASARVSNGLWRSWNGREPWAFDEFALRLPAYLAAVASILALGLLLRSWVSPAVGVAGAFLLALHPWHVEHGPELRSYGYVGLLAIASCWLLVRVLRKPDLRRISLFALAQFLLLWSHPFTVYMVGCLGLAGAAGLALRGGGVQPAARLLAALTLAGMAWLQVMAPNLAQTRLWTDVNEPSKGRVVQSRALESLTGLAFAGLPRKYGVDDPDRDAFPSIESLAAGNRLVAPAVYGVLPLLTLLGFARLVARRGPERWAALGLGLAVPLAIAVSWAGQLFFHERFVFYALIPVVIFVPVGLEGLLRVATRPWPPARRVAVPLGLLLGLWGFHALVSPRNQVLRSQPYAPMREVAAFTRETAGNDPLSVIRLGYGSGGEMPSLYDPWIRRVHDRAGVAAAMRRARRQDRGLLVFYGYPTANRPNLPSGFELLDDEGLFSAAAHFRGADPHFSYWVLRYSGAPVED